MEILLIERERGEKEREIEREREREGVLPNTEGDSFNLILSLSHLLSIYIYNTVCLYVLKR